MTGIDKTTATGARSDLFFEAVHTTYRDAVACGSAEIDRYFRVAERTIRLSFAGDTLEQILAPAFAHVECERVECPDLTIHCWDDASTRASTPEPPTIPGRAGMDFVDGSVRIAWEPALRSLFMLDSDRNRGMLRFVDADSAAVWEPAAPCLRILHWWATGLGMQVVHAAAVGVADGGVLLVGRGGSGKSTTALACIGSALGYLADDYCMISMSDEPRVHSLYSTGKADTRSVSLLPALSNAFEKSAPRTDGKRVIFLTENFDSALLRSCPLRAVVVPRIGGTQSKPERISPAHALRMVAPSTMMQLPGDRPSTLARLADLVKSVPCYEMTIGPDPYAAITFLGSLSRGDLS